MRLPLAPLPPQSPAPSAADQGYPAAASLRVLVVDDSLDAAKVFGRLLETYGFQVCPVHEGHRVVEVALEYRAGVVLLDIGMPGMDGYEVARRIRQEPSLQDVMLVATTGFGQESARVRTLEAGFDHHLVKPVDIDQLLRIFEGVR